MIRMLLTFSLFLEYLMTIFCVLRLFWLICLFCCCVLYCGDIKPRPCGAIVPLHVLESVLLVSGKGVKHCCEAGGGIYDF